MNPASLAVNQHWRRDMRLFLAITLAIIPFLTGCASEYGTQKTEVNYYPACYRPIQDLREREHVVAKDTAGGAFMGALGGALVGFLTSGGHWQGAVTGAATGGVTGTMLGYAYGREEQEKGDNKRMARYFEEIEGEISNLDISTAAARVSLQCYDKSFNELLPMIKDGQIDRATAEKRFEEISTGRSEAIEILGYATTQGEDLATQFKEAMGQAEASGQAKEGAMTRAKKSEAELREKTAKVSREKDTATEASARQAREMREALEKTAP